MYWKTSGRGGDTVKVYDDEVNMFNIKIEIDLYIYILILILHSFSE